MKLHPLQGHAPRGLSAFIYASLLCGIVALPISIANAIDSRNATADAAAERVSADLASCDRGNDIRQDQIDLIQSSSTGFVSVVASLATILGPVPAAELHGALDPVLADLGRLRGGIQLVDCREMVPGAK